MCPCLAELPQKKGRKRVICGTHFHFHFKFRKVIKGQKPQELVSIKDLSNSRVSGKDWQICFQNFT